MFTVIDDILTVKDGKSMDRNDFGEVFNLYMVQRWLSMHSDKNVEILNSTVNISYKTLGDEQHFQFMLKMLPATKDRKRYIKVKSKAGSKKGKDTVDVSSYFEESSTKIEESLAYVLGDKYNNE